MAEENIRILVVDDDPGIRRFLRISLLAAGHTMFESDTGQQGIEACASYQPELVLLDLGLPDMNGLEVLRQLREWTKIPVIILSVRQDEPDKVKALDAGADDYLTKPFSAGELMARIRTAMRHSPQTPELPIFETGDLSVDLARRRVRVSGVDIQLTRIEYSLLKALVIHAGKIVTQRQLAREAWGDETQENAHLLRVHIGNLRAKIEPEPTHPRYIITEPGVGYRLRIEAA
jgi:two-component system, OmpR family, KDP operon response regulator KdpE